MRLLCTLAIDIFISKITPGAFLTNMNVLSLHLHRAEGPRRQCISQDTLELGVLSMEISLNQSCGAKNLKVILGFLENI
jgi:hypothetical protein